MDSEAKTAVISVYNDDVVLSPVDVVAMRPHNNNSTSSFTKLVESTAAAAAKQTSGARFLNWSVDGVSLEYNYVWR